MENFSSSNSIILKNAFLTRVMSKSERNSEPGHDAVRKEMTKMAETYKTFEPPIESDAVPVGSTFSWLAMLTHIKHYEKTVESWIYKGRAVLLGNQVRPVHHSDINTSNDNSKTKQHFGFSIFFDSGDSPG